MQQTEATTQEKPREQTPKSGGSRRGGQQSPRKQGGGRGRGRQRDRRSADTRPDFEQKVVDIRRVSRVMAGGRRFSFSATVVVGDRNGAVGVGVGKANDTAGAIEKAVRIAKKNIIRVNRTENHSISHAVSAKYCGSEIYMRPAPGKGRVAGSSARVVFELAGITDISAKMLSRSKNKLNNAQAAVAALKKLNKETGQKKA